MRIRINEDAFKMLIGEARGFKSGKLQNIFSQHGGWDQEKEW